MHVGRPLQAGGSGLARDLTAARNTKVLRLAYARRFQRASSQKWCILSFRSGADVTALRCTMRSPVA